ncbi:MAG: hypothetical protein GPJ54_01380 [Candidatus Heimdallarchaeota archaeon]|nr:hypothetical protein [Candidatus Heimdallarchaeota archaeon]
MGQRANEISSEFQTKISDQFAAMDINDGFIFLTGISNYITKVLNELIGNSYVEIAKQLRNDELRIDDVHKYVAKIIHVLQVENKAPDNLNKTTQDLFELIDQLEKDRINRIGKSPEQVKILVQQYLTNLKDFVVE